MKVNGIQKPYSCFYFEVFCILESFNTNISHKLFVNNLCDLTALEHKVILYSKTELKISGIQNKSDSNLVWRIQLISIKGKTISYTQHNFKPLISINCIHQPKSESKIYKIQEVNYA